MGKHEFLTPKAIAKKIKAKGLQKTRWYCEMCKKQCRDANGFKCHLESDSHQRQMQIFGQNSGKFIDQFSREFEAGMMTIIKTNYRNKKVHANVVYNDYIRDREHVHMNATKWVTLTSFVMYLGKTGKCKVEETPKGWYITYIEKDPEVLARQEAMLKKERLAKDEEERTRIQIEKQIKRARKSETSQKTDYTELVRDNKSKVGFSFAPKKAVATETEEPIQEPPEKKPKAEVISTEDEDDDKLKKIYEQHPWAKEGNRVLILDRELEDGKYFRAQGTIRKILPSGQVIVKVEDKFDNKSISVEISQLRRHESAIDFIIRQQELKKERINRTDYWLTEGIVVKVMNKELAGGKYYKQKGTVKKVFEKYIALIRMNESGDVLKIDQSQLETVIPQIGKRVRIVNGAYRNTEGILMKLNIDNYSALVKLETGTHTGMMTWEAYEDISKIA